MDSHSSSTTSTQSQPQWFDTVLRRIGDEVAPDEYHTFGLNLGVPREMSENIRMSEEEVFPDVTIALLRQWTRKLGFTPEQLAVELVKALRAIQLERLASTIHEEIKHNEEEWKACILPNNVADTLSKRLESQTIAKEDSQEIDARGSKSVDNGLSKQRRKPKANYLIQPNWKFY
eukprot:XP_011681713.1 PREDICTED: uncharacterized protein LOC576238 [Strongylocentrotus purpuratus]